MRRLVGWVVGMLALPAVAATAEAPSAFSSLVQVVVGLAVVLAAIMACAWAFRRLQSGMGGMPRLMKVVGGVMVGQRERVVVVELEGEWLVLGVTPQQVNLLSKLPRPIDVDPAGPSLPEPPFAKWLKAVLDKQRSSSAQDHNS